eukprot:scaffold873_cov393-Prasinococcus_capsulatus_cf.AAC.14
MLPVAVVARGYSRRPRTRAGALGLSRSCMPGLAVDGSWTPSRRRRSGKAHCKQHAHAAHETVQDAGANGGTMREAGQATRCQLHGHRKFTRPADKGTAVGFPQVHDARPCLAAEAMACLHGRHAVPIPVRSDAAHWVVLLHRLHFLSAHGGEREVSGGGLHKMVCLRPDLALLRRPAYGGLPCEGVL